MSIHSICPQCGHSLLSQLLSPVVQHSDATSISREASRLEELIGQLTEKRVALLQRLNEDQASTGILPSEILSTIFEYACPPIDFEPRPFRSGELDTHPETDAEEQRSLDHRYFPLIIGAVCSRWRHIAWSTPALWTTMAIEVWPGAVKIRSAMSLLQLYMQNTGALLFAVEVDFRKQRTIRAFSDGLGSQGAEIPLEPIRELIFLKHARKIKNLRLSAPPPEWLSYLSENFMVLEDLSLGWPLSSQVRPHEDISLEGVLALRRLTIHNMVADLRVQLRWSAITVLNLRNVRYSTCAELLIQSPNLVSYHSYAPLHSNAMDPEPQFGETLTFAHLEDFGWTCQGNTSGWDEGLFRSLHLPSLKKLCLSNLDPESNMVAEISFLSRLPSTLTSLEFDTFYHPNPNTNLFDDVFSAVPQISQLVLSNSCIGLLTMISSSLTPSPYSNNTPLPRLRHLKCSAVWNLCNTFTGHEFGSCDFDFAPFEYMLEVRKRRGLNAGLLFEMSDGCEKVWEVGIRERIVEMVHDGLELEIMEDGRPVDWLY